MFRNERWFAWRQIISACLFAIFCASAAGAQETAPTLNNQVSQLETSVFGSSSRNKSLLERIGKLEQTVFGAQQSGPIATRLETLQHTTFAGDSATAPVSSLMAGAPEPQPVSTRSNSSTTPDTRALLLSGVVSAQQGNETEARQVFNNVLAIDRRNADAYFNLGALAEKDGNLPEALADYQRAALYRPSDKQAKDAATAVQRQINYDRMTPVPLRSKKPIVATGAVNIPQMTVMQPVSRGANVTQPSFGGAQVALKEGVGHKTKGFLHKVAQVAKVGAIAAATVLENASVQYPVYGNGYVDTCACR